MTRFEAKVPSKWGKKAANRRSGQARRLTVTFLNQQAHLLTSSLPLAPRLLDVFETNRGTTPR